MNKWTMVLAVLLPALALESARSEKLGCCDVKVVSKAEDAAATAMEKLKSLVGDWEMVNPPEGAPRGKVTVQYKLIGKGSSLVETIFPGTDMEMLSVYHRDGDQVVMTHYCAAGNQPRMRVKPGQDANELVFEFTGGANLNPDKDYHIHGGRVRFVDGDHIQSEWVVYAGGKQAGKHAFELVRRKN